MNEAQTDHAATAADRYARALAGGDDGLYARLFTGAYNLAHDLVDADPDAKQEIASRILRMISNRRVGSSALPLLPVLPRGGDGPGGSIMDDPVYAENLKYVVADDARILNGTRT